MRLTASRRTVLAAGVIGCMVSAFAQPQPPIRIGFLATLSGALAPIGRDQHDAFMLAVEERGGKLGGVPVQILKEDDQFKPEVGTQLVQKLIERDNVPIITGITGSNVLMAIAKPVTERRVFLVSTNAGPSPLAGAQCNPYLFVASWQADVIAEVVGKYATDKGYRRVALMAPNYQGGKDILAGFKRHFKGEVLSETYTPLPQLDFSAELAQVSAAKPDALYAFYPGASGVSFVRQYQQSGLLNSLPLLTTGIIDGTTLPALRESAQGIIAGHVWGPDLDNPSNRQFVQAFEAKYGRIPSNFAAQAYDGALLLDSAVAKVKGNLADKNAFAAALKAADFKSVRGSFRFGRNNFPIQDLHIFEAVKDAKGRMTMKIVATPLKAQADAYAAQCPMK